MLLKDQELGASLSWEAPFTADLTTTTLLILVISRNLFFAMVSIDDFDTDLKGAMQLAIKDFSCKGQSSHSLFSERSAVIICDNTSRRSKWLFTAQASNTAFTA